MASWLSIIIGLGLTLFGSGILACSAMSGATARIRQYPGAIGSKFCHERVFVWVARRFGSDDPWETEDFDIPTASKNFWGFILIFLGTILQILGALRW